MNFTFK